MDGLASRASMIRLSLQPSPASETSAFNNIRAFSSRRAGLFPFRTSVSSCWRSPPLNSQHTSLPKHQILSNWLKRTTSVVALPELFYSADMACSVTFNTSPLVLAAAIYLLMLWPVVRLVSRLERGSRRELQEVVVGRVLRIGGAQMGPIQKADSRQAVVRRMLDLLDQARPKNATSSSIRSLRSPPSFRAGT